MRPPVPQGQIAPAAPPLDSRDAPAFLAALLARRPGYVPEWQPPERGAEAAVMQTVARYLQTIAQRLNQAPGKNELAFLDLLGIRLVPAQAARAPVVFRLAPDAANVRMPAGTRVAAPPPPGSNAQIVYETERSTGLAVARLKAVVSLWPGRDQYIDHSAALANSQPIQPFDMRQLQNTSHALYLAHDTLLVLSGKSSVDVDVELATPGSDRLDILWEYWDGQVWREFLNMRPACDVDAAAKLDSTAGLTRSGTFRLQTECAQAVRTAVDGVEAFWVRGRLTETLPPDPGRVLPEVASIRLSTDIAQPFAISWMAPQDRVPPHTRYVVKVRVRDITSAPLAGMTVDLISATQVSTNTTDAQGETSFQINGQQQLGVRVSLGEFQQGVSFALDAVPFAREITFTLKPEGLALDKAFSDGTAIDVTKPFFPLGTQPQPGSTFYFSNAEVFSKPGAKMRVYVQPAQTPQDQLNAPVAGAGGGAAGAAAQTTAQSLLHSLSWEYWNGRDWTPLHTFSSAGSTTAPDDFTAIGLIDLTVPVDMESTKVNDQDGLWMRVRLVSGGFGSTQTIQFTDVNGQPHQFSFFVAQPPALASFLLGYTWQYGPFPPEHALAYNDFQYEDDTAAVTWPGRPFQAFKPVGDDTPALYLGFDKGWPVDDLGILFDVVEQPGETEGPALVWEYWDGVAWQRLVVDDETRNFRLPGLVTFIGPDDSQPYARFDTPLSWLRARLKEDGPPGAPVMNGIYPNAVWTVQHQTIVDEALGASTGQASQVFAFRQIPVLADPQVEVRELAGLRAGVEWRLVAMDLFSGDARILQVVETMLSSEGPQTDIQQGDLRLVRDRNKRVIEVWVLWKERPDLFLSGPNDRHYVVDHARGRLLLGDGEHGKIPPSGAPVVARQYRTGGGLAGNVAAGTINQVLGPIGGVEKVFNPRPAEGGAEAETLQALATRGPRSLRHRGRAIAPGDYETMAKEAAAAVAVAHALACRDASGRPAPGWVTLVLIPVGDDPRPYPSFGLREEVQTFLEARAVAELAGVQRIHVTGPDYTPIDVDATIVPIDPAAAGDVETSAQEALATFLHPVHGGPAGRGWQPGRAVFLSDVAAALKRVAGIDYIKDLALLLKGVPQGELARINAGQIVAAGTIRVKLIER